ncbi:glycerol-3-phosphate dehydrogenase [Halomonas sp. BM-2019]|uniref:glycerol-3-phosphate dehydrogenase n=1 Tax=Halomonas sp. BM-2019 TaxID=2811227 RepID=UPI001B3C2AFD|nr:MAG: glycerol-3-phosphate dehydrogenase [Halomonas sp. BM-2019]
MTQSPEAPLDLFVIGGGINGIGIANDAAGRGLRVGLCEQGDLAGATSSASSKLIHGGLRYLEHREFRLVRQALREREVLLAKAPHIIWPLRFLLPYRTHLRPAWMIRTGLFLYDHLGRRKRLPGSRGVRIDASLGLRPDITRGFEYSDCWVDDARLVVLNALQAREHGAEVLVRTRCVGAREVQGLWELELEDLRGGARLRRHARALVNAAGPWVEQVLRQRLGRAARHRIRLIQGSHLVVPRLNADERAYILQNQDGRIVFVLPWEAHFSLVGTTERRYAGDPARVTASDEEVDYLLAVVNAHFRRQLARPDVLWSFSGVRPLCDSESLAPSAMTRDYTLDLNTAGAPLLSVFGGKITTYRRLAEAALARLAPHLPPMAPAWTETTPLPGGDIGSPAGFTAHLLATYPWLGEARARRFTRAYGSLCLEFLEGARGESDLGEAFGAGLSAREVDYLIDREWAGCLDDILWRRTKLGIHLDESARRPLADYLTTRLTPPPVGAT